MKLFCIRTCHYQKIWIANRNLIQLSGQSAQFSNWLPKSDWWIWLNFWIFIQLCIESIWLMIGSSVIGPTICCCDVCIFSNFIILGAVAGMSRMLEWLSNCSYQFLKRMNATLQKKRSLCLMKCPSETLQNLTYFIYKWKPKVAFSIFHFM